MTQFNENISGRNRYLQNGRLMKYPELQEAEASRPIHEQFGMTVEEWNRSQEAWDVLHDMHGLRGLEVGRGR